ncbi:hypothetical protein DEU56DRAFT_838495 [Suillus clintonianus]|uniref:uncharacterized protein n=1 Tax=Suillus clintonianus TaxID=1904413 RepID=UPI001B87A1E5|nr:uncharacterized protein DEU56DRAFT_838495 [Suillus clintonianus]KAG2118381.1 hypothetical protein DEU56DRAFT_838495 [Suillus clintonianus]
MKFTSLNTMVISAAVMAGVAIASDDLVLTPQNMPCYKPVGCSTGLKGYNNGDDFGYFCVNGKIATYGPCSCKHCCTYDQYNFSC